MLLSYIIYLEGLVVPHVAAGINLNLPLVGGLLRKCGAFFLRRTFGGNRLYAAVFDTYLAEILARGFPVEYFIEGGRSRTGFMLRPKGGMLNMTVRAWLNNQRRPLVFVPVYFGYEKLIEGDAFVSELSGLAKSRESLAGLARSLGRLREDFGSVYVSFGEPLPLEEFLDSTFNGWRSGLEMSDDRLAAAVEKLGPALLQRVNESAAVTPVGLLAMILLAMPKQAMPESELSEQIDLTRRLLDTAGYSPRVSVTEMPAAAIIMHGQSLGVIARREHPLGDIIFTPPQAAARMTFFRNNLLHTVLAPAIVASCFVHRRSNSTAWIEGFGDMIYPYLREELCLRWTLDEFRGALGVASEQLIAEQLLDQDPVKPGLRAPRTGTRNDAQLQVLGRLLMPVFQCYYLAIALLIRYGSGAVTARQLERLCQMSAQRLTLLYELESPDLFQRSRFQGLIAGLQSDGTLHPDDSGKLGFGSELPEIEKVARRVLGQEMRHSILSAAVLPDVSAPPHSVTAGDNS
jgi:glycerol-3-phosphate O-acyltransferase